MQDHTAERPPLPSHGPLVHRDKCARFPGSHRRAKRGSSYVRYMGLDSIRNGQVSASTDVDQICVWGVDGLPGKSQSVQRLDVL